MSVMSSCKNGVIYIPYLPLQQVVSKLHLILKPFLLRRLKKDVEKSLPKKKEIILYTPMTSKQSEFHDYLVKKTLNEYFEEKGNNPGLPEPPSKYL